MDTNKFVNNDDINISYIPLYLDIMKKHNLSYTSITLFGFVYTFVGIFKKKFMRTDEQLGKLLGLNKSVIQTNIKSLKDANLIKTVKIFHRCDRVFTRTIWMTPEGIKELDEIFGKVKKIKSEYLAKERIAKMGPIPKIRTMSQEEETRRDIHIGYDSLEREVENCEPFFLDEEIDNSDINIEDIPF